jgi:ribosome maturation factor RimP
VLCKALIVNRSPVSAGSDRTGNGQKTRFHFISGSVPVPDTGENMNRNEYEKRTEELILPILREHGFELVDVEFVKEGSTWYLRSFIDKNGGINVDDCETVSRALEKLLDKEDFIREAYVLEVSSPGLGRALKKEKDYIRNEGKEIELRLYQSFEHEKEFRGILKSWTKDNVSIETEEGRVLTFEKKDLALVREAFDW